MRRATIFAPAVAALLVLGGCSDDGAGAERGDATTTSESPAYPRDGELRVHEIQVLGSHNSYHLLTDPEVLELVRAFDPATAAGLEYAHPPLAEQLDRLGLRQFELDVFADPEGGRYARRVLPPLAGLPAESGEPALDEPGFKVLHVQDVDYRSSCPTLAACLEELRGWSAAHPGHAPVFVLVEAKDDPLEIDAPIDFTVPVPIDGAQLDALDAEIRSVMGDERLLTPDDVRGGAATLGEAVASRGWPTLGEARDKFVFLLDNEGLRDEYRAGRPSLEGRVMFTSSRPGEADAAFAKLNDPVGDARAIADALRAHMLVRTRADADTVEARTNDKTQRDAALASGAQLVSTDYAEPDPDLSVYSVTMPDGGALRCNPVTAPSWCRTTDVER